MGSVTLIRLPPQELVGTFPLGEGKGMRKPLFSLMPKAKHSFGDEGKLPFPRACLPLRGRCRQLLRRRRMRVTQKVSSWFKLSDKLHFSPQKTHRTPVQCVFLLPYSAISFTTSYTLQSVLCQAMGDTEMYPARTASMSMVRSQRSYSMGAPTCIYISFPRYSNASE